ncbi:MAG: hypothetical protein B6U76_03480 [Desulfurococcales archaeon ex4484_217_2]|nr:MAG: hypothetical protein B6U76_03480 [Desulfurococcales archaeon ex4484_217_2]
MSKYMKIVLKQSTPASIGWYEPECVDPSFYLRPSTIKGLWRWFTRAFIAGALYDSNLLCSVEDKIHVKKVKKNSANAISYLTGKIAGLGFIDFGSFEPEASRFKINVEIVKWPSRRSAYNLGRLQRVRLLALGGRRVGFFGNGEFKLNVSKTREVYKEGEELALRTLLVSLSLMGLGKGSRRALGCFDIVDVSIDSSRLKDNLCSFLEETYKLALSVVNRHKHELKLRTCSDETLPPLPVFSKRQYEEFPITAIYKVKAGWEYVHNFFLRGERCKRILNDPRKPDTLRTKLSAWILGLPREQRRTGYSAKKIGVERRASPIIVSYHSRDHIFGDGVYITVFASADWPKSIEWCKTPKEEPQTIGVDEGKIIAALKEALDELWSYLGVKAEQIWPCRCKE